MLHHAWNVVLYDCPTGKQRATGNLQLSTSSAVIIMNCSVHNTHSVSYEHFCARYCSLAPVATIKMPALILSLLMSYIYMELLVMLAYGRWDLTRCLKGWCECVLNWESTQVYAGQRYSVRKSNTNWLHGSSHKGSHWTWNAPTQHQHRRWPDPKQIVETAFTQA